MIETSQVIEESDTNEAWIKIYKKKHMCCPIKTWTICTKDQNEPWINQYNKNNMLKYINNYKLYKQRIISEREYKSFRILVNCQFIFSQKKSTSNESSMKIKQSYRNLESINKVLSKTVKKVDLR